MLQLSALVALHWVFLDFVPQVLCWMQILTEGRSWLDSDVVLLEKFTGGSGSVGIGTVLLEHAMLVTAEIGHNVKLKDLIDIPQSSDAITSMWSIFWKLTGPWLIPMSPQTMMLCPPHESLSITHILRHTHTLPSAVETQNRLSSQNWTLLYCSMVMSCCPLQAFLSVTICKNRTSSRTSTMDIVGGQAATDGVGTDGSLLSSNDMMNRLNCKTVNRSSRCWRRIKRSCRHVVTDSGTTTARAIVGAVTGGISMLQTVDGPDVNVICIFTLSCS